MQTPIFVANWKMHHGPRAAREFVAQFLKLYQKHSGRTVILCPSAVSIEAVATLLRDRPEIGTGVQNIWTEPKGAFTRECSAALAGEASAAKPLGVYFARRHPFRQTNTKT